MLYPLTPDPANPTALWLPYPMLRSSHMPNTRKTVLVSSSLPARCSESYPIRHPSAPLEDERNLRESVQFCQLRIRRHRGTLQVRRNEITYPDGLRSAQKRTHLFPWELLSQQTDFTMKTARIYKSSSTTRTYKSSTTHTYKSASSTTTRFFVTNASISPSVISPLNSTASFSPALNSSRRGNS